jgi:hypothetical protein
MFGDVHFTVGEPPDGWPSVLKPASALRVVGGTMMGPMRSAVYELPFKGDAVASIEAQLLKTGFTRAKPWYGQPSRGFTSSAPEPGEMHAFCGTIGAVGFGQVDSTKTTRTIAMSFMTDKQMSPGCSDRMDGVDILHNMPLKLPPLRAPRGVSVTPGGMSSSGESFETNVRTDTTMSAQELLAHYAKELSLAGWQVVRSPILGEGVGIQQVSAKDDKGNEWRGMISVVSSSSRRVVTLRMLSDRSQ